MVYKPQVRTGNTRIDTSQAPWVIGSDEAGYGTWAGPLVVVACAVLRDWSDPEVADSKKLSDRARVAVVRRHREKVLWSIRAVPPTIIDTLGVWKALIRAHNEVHQDLVKRIEGEALHIVDGLANAGALLDSHLVPLPKADDKVPAVSLASCFAKVVQCELMDAAHKQYPQYGFKNHRGYGVPEHQAALKKHGVCPLHRKSYRPVQKYLHVADESAQETLLDRLMND